MDNTGHTSSVADIPSSLNTASTIQLANTDDGNVENGAETYKPFENRDTANRTSDFGALLHLFKGSLGSGILAIPLAFKSSGLALGLVGTVVVGYLCAHTVQILVECSQLLSARVKKPSLDFKETASAAFATGPLWIRPYATLAGIFVSSSLFLTYYFGNTVYVVLIATTIQEIINTNLGVDYNVRIYILLLCPPLIPLGSIRTMKHIVPVSLIGSILIILGLIITFGYAVRDLSGLREIHLVKGMEGIPLFFATILFAMEGIGTVLPIENTMKHPNHFLGKCGVLKTAMILIIVIYCVFGAAGYMKYGEETKASLILNLPNTWFADLTKGCVALSILFTYGLQFCVPSELIWNALKSRVSAKYENVVYYAMRSSMILGTVVIALIIPDLGPFISLVGSVFLSILGLFIPAMIELVTLWETDRFLWIAIKDTIIMFVSILALCAGSYYSILDIIHKHS